jgi:mono/diheme cytochrome c family protein
MRDDPRNRCLGNQRGGICAGLLLALFVIVVVVTVSLASRFLADVPVDYADPEQHFKYGSTGGEREAGLPFWVWKALPHVCEKHVPGGAPQPGREYASFGFLYEPGRDLPVGMSQRRHLGLDRVFLNCAACHTSTVRDTPDGPSKIITGMPANTVDLMAFEKFMFDCAKSDRFSPDWIMPKIAQLGGRLDLLDRLLIYPVAIHLTRDRLIALQSRFAFMLSQPAWGPGRVDTFGSAKALFNFPMDKAPASEKIGVADFPSIWLQRPRKEGNMQLHWDGNNVKVEERNRSAAFGTGATPPTLDRPRIQRIEGWLLEKAPPPYPYAIDRLLADRGATIYGSYCAGCHGIDGRNFSGAHVGKVTPIQDINTDPRRLDSYTYDLAVNQNLLYAGYGDERFSNFRKTFGYANMPLDGLWLRAPYLHNGSVPTLRDLLEPAARRPKLFYRGNDLYDRERVGFVSQIPKDQGRAYFEFNTDVAGNSNRGHEGARYGTELPPEQKAALIEFLKTF